MSTPHALPASTVADPADAPPLRWGILGTGWIAERFTAALREHTRQRPVAAAARSAAAARQFADRFGIARAHADYDALVADPEIDIVYIATVHHLHLPHAELALRAGKHVLVEKPLALNAAQAQRLEVLAADTGVFCMEAMWTSFLPKYDVVRQVLYDGLLGELRSVVADFGEHFRAGHRILRPELAGGPLLDLGIYPVVLAHRVLGPPDTVLAFGTPAPSGVNGQAGILLGHAGGAESVLHTSVFSATPTTAVVAGTEAVLTIAGEFYRPGPFRVDFHDGRDPLVYDEPRSGYAGLAYEAAECARRIAAGQTGSPLRTLADSIATLATLDAVRDRLGVRFDADEEGDR